MEDDIEFITVCPDNSNYVKQIELLNFSLKLIGLKIPKIIIPHYSDLGAYDLENTIIKSKLENKTNDKYFEKFVLRNINQFAEKQYFLFLDPDHIVFEGILLTDFAREKTITVSSEINKLNDFLTKREVEFTAKTMIKSVDVFYNTSLIFSDVNLFRKFASHWQDSYENLYNEIDHRHLEEIALSISSMNNGYEIESAADEIQGNFKNKNINSKIFHYGGEYKEANFVKQSIVHNVGFSLAEKYQLLKQNLCLLSNT